MDTLVSKEPMISPRLWQTDAEILRKGEASIETTLFLENLIL